VQTRACDTTEWLATVGITPGRFLKTAFQQLTISAESFLNAQRKATSWQNNRAGTARDRLEFLVVMTTAILRFRPGS
jgi:hypothetical protein